MFNSFFFLRLKRKIFPFLFILKPLMKIAAVFLLILIIINLLKPVVTKTSNILNTFSLLFGNKTSVLKQENNYTNILIMGIGGGTHEGAQLTDSMIVINLNINRKNVSLITIPRDLWIEELQAKINTAYQTGEEKKKSVGLVLAKATVEQILGIPIQYGLVLDFHAFEKIVDTLGGVDIIIDNSFEDNKYPIEGKENDLCQKSQEEQSKVTEQNVAEIFPCRFEKLIFTKGKTHMAGATALKFVRSRHAQGDEGTDFARSKRQLKLIEAIKSELVKPQTLLNPGFILKINNDLQSDINSDLSITQMVSLAKNYANLNISSVKTFVLDMGIKEKSELLINPPVSDYGAWVLVPKTGNWEEIHDAIKLFLGQ